LLITRHLSLVTTMLIINQSVNNPYFNIASEEYLLKNFSEDIFILYSNSPSIIVGKHQNTMAEINHRFVSQKHIPVIRRLSGGGTVYHDLGNVNYSFITNGSEGNLVDFKKHTQPVIDVLKSLGVDARIGGKNDIRVGDKKISGNAEHIYKNRVLHHGTLLFNANLDELNESIKVNLEAYTDRAVKSIRSQVANITEYLNRDISIEKFKEMLIAHIKTLFPNAIDYQLTPSDIDSINELIATKFSTWEWNYGYSPTYILNRQISINNKFWDIEINVEKGIIVKVTIKSNSSISKSIEELEELMIGCIHEKTEISQRLVSIDLKQYLPEIAKESFIENLF